MCALSIPPAEIILCLRGGFLMHHQTHTELVWFHYEGPFTKLCIFLQSGFSLALLTIIPTDYLILGTKVTVTHYCISNKSESMSK